jgi:hypothetical protein
MSNLPELHSIWKEDEDDSVLRVATSGHLAFVAFFHSALRRAPPDRPRFHWTADALVPGRPVSNSAPNKPRPSLTTPKIKEVAGHQVCLLSTGGAVLPHLTRGWTDHLLRNCPPIRATTAFRSRVFLTGRKRSISSYQLSSHLVVESN